jgi:hypothetical protein
LELTHVVARLGAGHASLLTILCVAPVHRDRPDWLAIGVGDAARAAALLERVSRLASDVARPFADVVDT